MGALIRRVADEHHHPLPLPLPLPTSYELPATQQQQQQQPFIDPRNHGQGGYGQDIGRGY